MDNSYKMSWCVSCVLFSVVVFFVAIYILIRLYFKHAFKHWKKLQVAYVEPSFPFGNCKDIFTVNISFGEQIWEWYKVMKEKGEKHMGFYFMFKPFYVPIELNLVKCILAKDFQHFYDRGIYKNEKDDPLSAHLFTLTGYKWKSIRNKLTPTFTSGKMKRMFQILVDCSEALHNCLSEPVNKGEPINIQVLLSQFTTDVIGSFAFGIECNSFTNPNNDFARLGKRIFQGTFAVRMKMFTAFILPKLAKFLCFRVNDKELEQFYMKLIRDAIEYREKNNVVRNDFVQLLMQLMDKGFIEKEDDDEVTIDDSVMKLTFNEIAAQAFSFFVAGYETSSTQMTFALYELSLAQNIQQRVREEVLTTLKRHNGEITYDAIKQMHYLDQVVQETLRLHPPIMFLQRICTKDYDVPGTDLTLKEGQEIMIPTLGIHYDPEYYPDPDKFDPDRFTEENKATRPDYTYLPFGEGPRICIGVRFAMLEIKVALCRLLKSYKFTLSPKTKQPLKLDPLSFVALAEGGIWLYGEKLSN